MSALSFDVAVVGAGPAGSTAAKVVAEEGLSTIVFDSRASIGIPVQCGEYLPTPREMRDLLPHSPRVTRLVDVANSLITNRCSRLRLVSPRMTEFEFNLEANVIDRAGFDQFLAGLAEKAGAEIRLRSTVIKRTKSNMLIIHDKTGIHKVSARVIVGADGTYSRIAQSIGIRYGQNKINLSPTIQFVMTNVDCDPNTAEMFFGREIAPGGYAWIIPKNESTANVGLGIRPTFTSNPVSLQQYLLRFIKAHPLVATRMKHAHIVRRTGGTLPIGGPVRKTYSDSVVLVGDAAGHVMASNGGGIPTALVGGDIAGHSIVRHLQEGVPLSWYEHIWKKEIGHELLSALAILRIADQVMASDSLTDQCMRLAGSRNLNHIIRCRLAYPVDLASKSIVKIMRFLARNLN